MKYFFIFFITVYQITISPLLHALLGIKNACRYEITCSQYTKQAIKTHGAFVGLWLGLQRFLSCQPFGTIRE